MENEKDARPPQRIPRHLWAMLRERVSEWFIGGVLLALTGFAPQEFIARLVRYIAAPERVGHLSRLALDARPVIVFVGIAIIVADALYRNRHRPVTAVPGRPPLTEDGAERLQPNGRALVESEPSEPEALALPNHPWRSEGRVILVVLPFESLGGGDKYDYFSEGLTEDMITQLARLSPERLGVIARTSAMRYKSTTKTIHQIGQDLGVSHVLEGSVRRAGDRVRVAAQLIRVSDETHLWAETYEGNRHDILALQIEVAKAIAREIEIKLTPHEQGRLDRTHAMDAQAHEAYLKGRHFWSMRTEDGMRKSIEYFQLAIEHQPNFAAAYDGVADAYTMLACRGVSPARETFHKAKMAARKALQIEPDLGEAYASLAHVRLHDWDWVDLEQDFLRAIELNPGHAIAYYWYAEYLMMAGRAEDAIARVRQSRQMDPLNSVLNSSVAIILYLARRYDQAREELHKALEIDPNHFLLHFRLGLVYQQQKLFDDAIEEMQKAVTLSGRSTEALTGLAQTYAAADMKAAMQQIVDALQTESEQHYVHPYNMAKVFGSLGDKEQTFGWLEKAYDEHSPDFIELRTEPTFDSVRFDPRFSELLSRVGFNQI
ncbi:tetratricopeptide repeat protein [Ralstonia pseudosolanacearum]|nr:tetratricopeptide repeat protein [Ralstonia pseudosolanacearum]UWD91230.1 tetratricopeptide repeat protein [Ralstonia pseudosolanacearum]